MTNEVQISEREREILYLVANGATNQQIAQELNISINTVKVHLRNIFAKIGVVSRTEATLYAVRTGLVQVSTVERLISPPVVMTEDTLEVEAAEETSESEDNKKHLAPPVDKTIPVEQQKLVQANSVKESSEHQELACANISVSKTPLDIIRPVPHRLDYLLIMFSTLAIALIVVMTLIFVLMSSHDQAVTRTSSSIDLPELAERWRELTAMPVPRAGFALTSFNFDGKTFLYVIAGETPDNVASDHVMRYDLTANVWVPFGQKPTAVRDVQAVVIGNRIYIPGGQLASGEITNVLEAYDPQRDRWVSLEPLPEPRSGYALAAIEGKMYLFGGWDGETYRDEVWQYNPDQDTWSIRTAMTIARAFAGATVLEGRIFVVGGRNETGKLNINESYTPAEDGTNSNPWSLQAPLPVPYSHMAISATSNLIFVLTGTETAGTSLLYNNNLDSWQQLETPLNTTLQNSRSQAVGNRIYILGGQDKDGFSARAYEYQAVYSVVLPLSPGF